MPSLRATGDRVLLRRVLQRGRLIAHVGEQMGITDSVLQLGEVVGLGSEWTAGRYRQLGLEVGDLVVYPTPRIDDHFRWHFGDNGGECDVIVLPGYWVSAIVKSWFLADNPELREYGDTLK